MSAHPRHLSARRSAAVRRRHVRRRVVAIIAVIGLAGVAAELIVPAVHDAVQEITLPLRHEDIIRQQAADKHVDPSLIAAVIYTESHFRDQTSHAGAKGLMQITPDTARYIAHLSGGSAFELDDLATPQVNISYGTYYLRYLLKRYDGNELLALAAYNGGEGNVDRWLESAGSPRTLHPADIPFPETRTYVGRVEKAKRDYRKAYASELGLSGV
ncbi:MAG TPA: lytic transglycosylase domain-containing protein [Solirubrobacteraceae bacterium]|nr:lytic transglycosylase domain-containing protein [Solirubrobacteraceae bacterium]